MGFQDVSGNINYVKYAKEGKPVFKKGEVIVEGRFSKQYVDETYNNLHYQFSTDDGIVDLNAAGHLKYLFQAGNVQLGDLVQIKYDGQGTKKIKGNLPHNFKLAVDKDAAPVKSSAPESDRGPDDELPI